MGTLERLNRTQAHTSRDTLYIEGPCALFNLQRRTGKARWTPSCAASSPDHRNGVLTGEELATAIGRLPGGAAALRELRIRR